MPKADAFQLLLLMPLIPGEDRIPISTHETMRGYRERQAMELQVAEAGWQAAHQRHQHCPLRLLFFLLLVLFPFPPFSANPPPAPYYLVSCNSLGICLLTDNCRDTVLRTAAPVHSPTLQGFGAMPCGAVRSARAEHRPVGYNGSGFARGRVG